MRRFKFKSLMVAAGVATLAVPSQAFACWSICVDTFGIYDQIDGDWYELDHCVQSWPDGSNTVHTTCYYRLVLDVQD